MPDSLKALQHEATDRARSRDALMEDAVDSFLENGPERFTLAAVADAVKIISTPSHGGNVNPVSERRLIQALRLRGFGPVKVRDGNGTRNCHDWNNVPASSGCSA